jgi:hypothetical protein
MVLAKKSKQAANPASVVDAPISSSTINWGIGDAPLILSLNQARFAVAESEGPWSCFFGFFPGGTGIEIAIRCRSQIKCHADR